RFALLALLEKKINSSSSKFEAQITSVPLITNSMYEDHARCLPAAQRFALLALLEKKINSSSSKFEAQITSVPLITN
ncbi:hypothetical protein J6590_106872, partial [Homalodisca vitripennis]